MQILNNIISNQFELASAFILFAIIIIIFGIKLSIYGEALSIRSNIDSGIIGIIFLAGITSLPELAVCLSSVINQPPTIGFDLSFGNILGSNLFNLVILAFLMIFYAHTFLNIRTFKNESNALLQSIILLTFLWMVYLIPNSIRNILIIIIPILYIFFIFNNKNNNSASLHQDDKAGKILNDSKIVFYSTLIIISLLIVLCGIILSNLSYLMTNSYDEGGFNLNASFIGTLFLALSTSLPELSICIGCLYKGLARMACGNIIGSNLFNILIAFICHQFLKNKLIIFDISFTHHITFLCIFLSSTLIYIMLKNKNKFINLFVGIILITISTICIFFQK